MTKQISDREFHEANARAAERLRSSPVVRSASCDFDARLLVIHLANGQHRSLSLDSLPCLQSATLDDLATIEVSPSGLGIHIAALDVDLYLPELLSQVHEHRAP
jgi:hypothetical protein